MSEKTKGWLKVLGPYVFAVVVAWAFALKVDHDSRTRDREFIEGGFRVHGEIQAQMDKELSAIKSRLGDL